jgi:hypothetical protein
MIRCWSRHVRELRADLERVLIVEPAFQGRGDVDSASMARQDLAERAQP